MNAPLTIPNLLWIAGDFAQDLANFLAAALNGLDLDRRIYRLWKGIA